MTALKIPVTEDITALRLHGSSTAKGAAEGDRGQWLLSLRDQQKERLADAAALHAFVASATDSFDAVPRVVGERIDRITEIAVELGLSVAREIVGKALDSGGVDPTETVRRCLRDCIQGSSGTELTVHLHPADLEIVQAGLAKADDLPNPLESTRLVADAQAGRGSVRVETEAGRLKYDPSEALARISDEVRREVRG